jgi:hypothetical protein
MRITLTPDRALYPFEPRWFDSSAGRMHYMDEGSGPPILLCHGNPTWSFLYRGAMTRQLTEQEMNHYRQVQPTPEARKGVAEMPKQIVAAYPLLERLIQEDVPDTIADAIAKRFG